MSDWGDAASGIFGAGASIFGNILQGKQQQQNAQSQFWYNLALQQQSQLWNKQMADTQYQRSVADLRAAGLNPILAAGGFSPAGGSAGGASVSQADSTNPAEGAVSSAEQAAKLGTALEAMKTEIEKRKADITLVKDQSRNTRADTALKTANTAVSDLTAQRTAAEIPGAAARSQREHQTAERERIVGPGGLNNLQTYVPAAQAVIKTISKPSTITPSSAKGVPSFVNPNTKFGTSTGGTLTSDQLGRSTIK